MAVRVLAAAPLMAIPPTREDIRSVGIGGPSSDAVRSSYNKPLAGCDPRPARRCTADRHCSGLIFGHILGHELLHTPAFAERSGACRACQCPGCRTCEYQRCNYGSEG